MAVIVVNQSDTLEEWRVKTNEIADVSGDLATIYTSPAATTGVTQNTQPGDVILALNNLEERKLNPTSNGSGLTSLNASNLSSGTVGTARLGSGTADVTKVLVGDQTWKTIEELGVRDIAVAMAIALS